VHGHLLGHRVLGAANQQGRACPLARRVAKIGRGGQRRWTRFESEQFKELFGEHRVIPIWAVDAIQSAFDFTAGVGGARFDPDGDIEDQARSIAELCGRKLDT